MEADIQAGRHVLVPVRDPSRDDRRGGRQGLGRVGWLGGCSGAGRHAEALTDAHPQAGAPERRSGNPSISPSSPASSVDSGRLDRHVAEQRRGAAHRHSRGRLVRLRHDRRGRVLGSHVRSGRHVPLRAAASIRGWRASSPCRRRRTSPRRRLPSRVLRPRQRQSFHRPNRSRRVRPSPSRHPSRRKAVIPDGELFARIAIVGVLIGGATLLFVRAVGGSTRRDEEPASS